MVIGIIGVGLLGGSFALGLRKKYPKVEWVGVDVSEINQKIALARGVVDRFSTIENLIGQSELVVLATPVDQMVVQLPLILDLSSPGQTIVDLGSTKQLLCEIADKHPKRNQYVAAHPMAGTENSGAEAAFDTLLTNKNVIICDPQKSHPNSLTLVETLFKSAGMAIYYMNPIEHDLHLAYVSHLSHVSSFALGLAVLEKEKDEKAVFDMASTGFSSTVRLAKSSPQMWAPIFAQNKKNVSQALSAYIAILQKFKHAIDSDNIEESLDFMTRANDIGRVLAGIEKS